MHTSHYYGGSDGDDGEDLEAAFRRLSPPENELATPLALRVELHRTTDVCVAIVGGSAYSTGVLLHVEIRVRPGSLTPEARRSRAFGSPFQEMLVGITLPGGEVVSTLDAQPWGHGRGPRSDGPVLAHHGGGWTDTAAETSVWLTPVPTSGRLGVVVAFPELGIGEVHGEIDAAPLAEASRGAVELWPWESEQVEDAGMPPERDLEPGGWFERHRPTGSDHDDG